MPFYNRRKIRLSDYDYSGDNYYFITICTHEKKCIFGKPGKLNDLGTIAKKAIDSISEKYVFARVDNYIVMPNHIHCIIALSGADCGSIRPGISTIIGQYKMTVTKQIRQLYPDMNVWQRSFYDHIIRSRESYQKIWNYVAYNDQKWKEDLYYSEYF